MKLADFLERLPEPFAIELLDALPAPDRRQLLRAHGCKVPVGAGTLKRADRVGKEARMLVAALRRSTDPDQARTFLQGWLARRAEMVVAFLDAWEVPHQMGIVEEFGWVAKLDAEKVKASLEAVADKHQEPIAPLVYFAYLELPVTEQVLDVDALFRGVATPAPA